MKPEVPPKHGYNFEVFSCPTPEWLQKVIKENKDREGFYPYFIPQSTGVLLVVATKNPEAFLDTKPRIELGLQPLKEHEAKKLVEECNYLFSKGYVKRRDQNEVVDTFLTWLYEYGYEVCKRVEKEAET